MEDLLARERAAELHVLELMKNLGAPILSVLEAFSTYRQLCETSVFADFEHANPKELRLWQAHSEGKKYFHRALSKLRKASDRPVETRQLMKLYLEFLKQSQRFYRGYIYKLSVAAGGISDLQAVAHQVKNDGNGESQQPSIPGDLRDEVLNSCHQTLIYLGDLSRYRASEKLDKNPDYGPAIGYYGLACTLCPSSGIGHHQQAVVALEQRHHLRAIYHLYRAMNVKNPHPNAAKNLDLEFNKTNAAWDKGELIQKGPPTDPDAPKRALIGWFVRLHSMCYKGEPFRGYDELEREVLSQLGNVLKQRSLDGTLMRMVLVNIAAQYTAGELFQANPTSQHQDAFLYFFRFNLRFFTVLLRVFYDDLKVKLLGLDNQDIDLADKLTPIVRHVLPSMRVYTNWLMPMINMVVGLVADSVVGPAVDQFWQPFARAVDLITQAFPIWDLEDQPEVTYMLEEDADTIGFAPLSDAKTAKTWYITSTDTLKPKFSDPTVVRVSPDDEMLGRIKDFLADGLHLANNDDQTPIHLRGTRVFFGDVGQIEELVVPIAELQPAATETSKSLPAENRKPISYAAAAANGNFTQALQKPVNLAPVPVSHSRDAQLSRMVDDLVDDADGNNPVTPPQQHSAFPTVVTNGEAPVSLQDSVHDLGQLPKHSPLPRATLNNTPNMRSSVAMSPPSIRPSPRASMGSHHHDRLQSVSSLWGAAPATASLASGPVTLAIGSPRTDIIHSHSRVNSASSIHSRTSQKVVDPWSSAMDLDPKSTSSSDPLSNNAVLGSPYTDRIDGTNTAGPLLFGAGGGLWSPGFRGGFRNGSPTHGQGG